MSSKNPRIVRDRCRYIAELVRNKTVLDVGCIDHDLENRNRKHWLHAHLIDSAKEVTGIDYLGDQIEQLKDDGYNVYCEDATNFNLNKGFDTVVAGEIIEHLSNPGLFLECARDHLNYGGTLVLTTPNANCMKYFIENLMIGREIENSDHVAIYSPKTISELLKRHGYSVKRIFFISENTSFYHSNIAIKILVAIKCLLQEFFCIFRQSMAHQMIVIATVQKKNGGE